MAHVYSIRDNMLGDFIWYENPSDYIEGNVGDNAVCFFD